MLIIVRGSVTRTCPKSNVSEEKGVSVDSNRRPSAYQHSSVPARPHLVGVRDIISGAVNTQGLVCVYKFSFIHSHYFPQY